jgi:hypothetical protein
MRHRLAFWRGSARLGWDWVGDVSNHASRVLLMAVFAGAPVIGYFLSPQQLPLWASVVGIVGVTLVALGEGAYQQYARTQTSLGRAQARLGDLDSVAARRALADQAIHQAEDFVAEINDPQTRTTNPALTDSDIGDEGELHRIITDIGHWEDDLRVKIRRISGRDAARQFDLNDAGTPDVILAEMVVTAHREYMERRIRRLREWKDTL